MLSDHQLKIIKTRQQFAKKMHDKIQITGADATNSLKNLKEENHEDSFLFLANNFANNINSIIYHLQHVVIKSDAEHSSNGDLKILANKLNKNIFELRDCFVKDSNLIKSELEKQIKNITEESELLLELIQRDELIEFKNELVDVLNDILASVHQIQIYNQVKQQSLEELDEMFEMFEKFSATVVDNNHQAYFDTMDPIALENLIKHAYDGVEGAQAVVWNVYKASNNYEVKTRDQLIDVARTLNGVCISIMQEMVPTRHLNHITIFLKDTIKNGFTAFKNLIQFLKVHNEDKRVDQNLKNVAYFGLSNAIVIAERFREGINIDNGS